MSKNKEPDQVHVLVQRILLDDLDDPDIFQNAYELLTHLLRHVPADEIEYFMEQVPREIEARRHKQAVRERRHLTLV